MRKTHLENMLRSLLSLLHNLLIPIRLLFVVMRDQLSSSTMISRMVDVIVDLGEFLIRGGGDDCFGALSDGELGGSAHYFDGRGETYLSTEDRYTTGALQDD